MGYSVVLVETNTSLSEHLVSYAAGCVDADDSECSKQDPEQPIVHFTLETWKSGNKRAQSLPDPVRPSLLNVQNYELFGNWYIWSDVVTAGLNSPFYLSLDFYRSYNISSIHISGFFDPWARIFDLLPSDLLVRCRDMGPNSSQPRNNDAYIKATGDLGIACSHDDTIWFSPACRTETSACIPLLLVEGIDRAMQVTFHRGVSQPR